MRWRILSAHLLLCACLIFGSAAIAKKKPPTQPVNINTANSEQLQQVPGIGPATAQKILQMRKSYGPFKSVNDLLAIRGLGQKRLDKMRKYLTVGKVPTSPKPVTTENPSSSHPKHVRERTAGGPPAVRFAAGAGAMIGRLATAKQKL